MEKIKDSSFFDYGKWFLKREQSRGRSLDLPIPKGKKAMEALFKERFSGKYQEWFPQAQWSIVKLTFEEFKKLMVLDAIETRSECLVIEGVDRTLKNAAINALATGYFETMRFMREKHFWYYLRYLIKDQSCQLSLSEKNRLVVRTLTENEKRNDNKNKYSYYLHDGWGRSLPYMVLLLQKRIEYEPVEAFLAEER